MNKRIINIVTALIVVAISAISSLAQEPAMYIYRNDGRMNAFLMNRVDSMSYSKIGIDGVEYAVPVVQEIWTKDSLYRIPISAIDSIGYQTPEPIFKDNIFFIDETNVGKVVDVDFNTLTITFRSGTPSSQLPTKGQIIFCDLNEEPFPMGFAGRVTKVSSTASGKTYTCDVASPEEVYDRLLVVGHIGADGTHNSSAKLKSNTKGHNEATYDINVSLLKPLYVKGKGTVAIDYTIDLNVFNDDPTSVYLLWQNDLDLDFSIKLKKDTVTGAIPSAWDQNEMVKERWNTPVRVLNVYGIDLYIMTGSYFSFEGDFTLEASGLKYKVSKKEEYCYNSSWTTPWTHRTLQDDAGWNFEDGFESFANDIKVKAELAGKISFGVCAEADIAIWKPKWASLGIAIKAGPELKGSVSLDTDVLKTMAQNGIEAAMYKEFSENVKLTLGVKVGADILARLGKKEWKLVSFSTTLFPTTVTMLPKLSKPALPKIYKVEENTFMLEPSNGWDNNLGWNSNNPLMVKTTAKNFILFPGPIGLSIYDSKGKELYNGFAEGFKNWHWTQTSSYATSINNYSAQKIKVYPQFKLFGFIPIKGEPAEITIPKSMTLSTNKLAIKEGESADIIIKDGWGYYTYNPYQYEHIARRILKEKSDGTQYIHVTGEKAGNTEVIVKDVRSGISRTCKVTVSPTPITLSTTSLQMFEQETRIVTISPKASYQVSSSNTKVATASLVVEYDNESAQYSTMIKVNAKKIGTATITITNPDNGQVERIDVTVRERGPACLNIEPTVIDFGTVYPSSTSSKSFTISNTGESNLTFKIAQAEYPFMIEDSEKTFKLQPNDSKEFDVTCNGLETGEEKTIFVPIETDILDGGGHGITLKANGDKGLCSNIYPEDGAVLDGTGTHFGCRFKMPFSGAAVLLFDIGGKLTSLTVNGREGDNVYAGNVWFNGLPNTKYNWLIYYFDYETERYVQCTPVMSFTTGN